MRSLVAENTQLVGTPKRLANSGASMISWIMRFLDIWALKNQPLGWRVVLVDVCCLFGRFNPDAAELLFQPLNLRLIEIDDFLAGSIDFPQIRKFTP